MLAGGAERRGGKQGAAAAALLLCLHRGCETKALLLLLAVKPLLSIAFNSVYVFTKPA